MNSAVIEQPLQTADLGSTGYTVEVDRVVESEWAELMAGFDDANLYQTWAYGAVRWGAEALSHLVLRQGSDLAGIAQVRIIRARRLGFGMGYLRWGPLCHPRGGELSPQIVQAMATALRNEYVRKRGLYLAVLPNAFAASSRSEIFQSNFSGFVCEPRIDSERYRTFVLDLAPSLDEIRKNLNKKWRNLLNAAEKNGLDVVAGEDIEEFRMFCSLYSQMQERKAFESSVNPEDFAHIQEKLPAEQKMRTFICMHDGQAVAALVCSAMGNSAIYLLGATNAHAMKLKAAYLLQWSTIKWLKEIGVRYYDLGGIDPESNPGVHHFKQGLSGADATHISPLVACDSAIRSTILTVGLSVRRGMREIRSRYSVRRFAAR